VKNASTRFAAYQTPESLGAACAGVDVQASEVLDDAHIKAEWEEYFDGEGLPITLSDEEWDRFVQAYSVEIARLQPGG